MKAYRYDIKHKNDCNTHYFAVHYLQNLRKKDNHASRSTGIL